MSGWGNAVENEREELLEQFYSAAKELCGRLKSDGYWSDFIDPSSGKPYYGQYTNTTMFETDEKYRLLGYRIEDLGCCKVISHREFGRHVFVGTIFTDAHPSSGVVQVRKIDFIFNIMRPAILFLLLLLVATHVACCLLLTVFCRLYLLLVFLL